MIYLIIRNTEEISPKAIMITSAKELCRFSKLRIKLPCLRRKFKWEVNFSWLSFCVFLDHFKQLIVPTVFSLHSLCGAFFASENCQTYSSEWMVLSSLEMRREIFSLSFRRRKTCSVFKVSQIFRCTDLHYTEYASD